MSTVDYKTAPGVECLTCGTETVGEKAHAAGFDYCRMCFYTCQAYEDIRRDHLNLIRAAMPGWTVGIEHTGGGCFWLAFYPPTDEGGEQLRGYFYCATDGEASLPDVDGVPIRGGWGYVARNFWDSDRPEFSDEHPDYEGTLILDAKPSGVETKTTTHAPTGKEVEYVTFTNLYWDEYPKHSRDDDEVVIAIQNDWNRLLRTQA